MSDEPLAYLLHRFATDAATLRARAEQLSAKPPAHGPDAAASRRMADACDLVLAQLNSAAARAGDDLLGALEQLGPQLEAQAARAPDAYVRSVYGGAAARVQEVVVRTRAALDDTAPDDDALDEESNDDDLDDDDFDDDVDDDDLHEDALDDDTPNADEPHGRTAHQPPPPDAR